MRFVSGMLAALLILVVTANGRAGEKPADGKSLIVGVWELHAADSGNSATLEFTKDAKVKMVLVAGGKATTSEGAYALAADKLTITRSRNGKQETETVAVSRLTANDLVLVNKGKEMSFRREVAAGPPQGMKLVGTWQTSDQEGLIKFTAEGKMVFAVKGLTIEGTYTLDGNKLVGNLKTPDGTEVAETMTIKSLSDEKLVTVDSKGKEEALKRVR